MPTLDSFIKMANDLSALEVKRDQLDAQIEVAKQTLSSTVTEAEQKGRAILAEATEQARQILLDAQRLQRELTQRETDVKIREEAVAYVDAQVEALKQREEVVAKAEQAVQERLAEANAAQQLWVTRQAELTAKAEGLAERERKLAEAAAPG